MCFKKNLNASKPSNQSKGLSENIGCMEKSSIYMVLKGFPDGSNIGSPDFVVVDVSHIQRVCCQPEKPTLHGGQFRSWFAEQGKKEK